MANQYLGESIKKLGFGFMRLPMLGEEIDLEQTKTMVDTFMSKGFTYFDTAYVYINQKSEGALKESLVDRYPRESFQIATKMPLWMAETKEDLERCFEESLERMGITYIDFYLIHAMSESSFEKAEKLGAWELMKKWKAQGRVKHVGFSFHDTAQVLEEGLKAHPETEFVQLQINYKDWEDAGVQARKCYEVARKYNTPVIIMEPVRGGSLAVMPPKVQALFQEMHPEMSVASWAMRYAASLEGVITVLSGMSNQEQMLDNVSYMDQFQPLNQEEHLVVDQVVEYLNSLPTIPCTKCKYCVDSCPQKINIPDILETLNNLMLYGNVQASKERYAKLTAEGGKASDCIACAACQGHCPQRIQIISSLQEAVEKLQ